MTTPTLYAEAETTAGRVRGFWRGEPGAGGSAAFLGIPFAESPVGELRFAAPVPVAPWDGVRDALEYGATAQRGDTGITLIPEPSVPGDATLNVNVFTPAPGAPGALRPVLVWIHGGGYVSGSPASPWYDGRTFNRDGVVTVTISYRLGFDGFGHIDGAPANRGVRDWLAALEWVQANIAAFGGDPSRVTIAGQSAGGGAVLRLLAMPTAQHLFHSAWALSAALADVSVERSHALSGRLAQLLGVEPTRTGFASAPEEAIRDLQRKAAAPESRDRLAGVRAVLGDGLSLGPAIDGDLITQPTIAALRDGVGADKPLMLGSTDDEFTMVTDSARGVLRFVPAGFALARLHVPRERRRAWLADNRAQRRLGTAAVLGRFATDTVFRSTVVRVAEARGAAPTWVYRFSWPSPTRRWSLHCLDVPFWFDGLDEPHVAAIAGDAPPKGLAAAMHGAAVAFARADDPGWRRWGDSPGITRVFGGAASVPDIDADGYRSVRALL
ncbi:MULTISPECIES: carboxylesterase/lipase family protein [Microbacterium]|uniref:Carboxylic ester hydrolase n=1 Tax=Microbacterium trichothecenolyticum TaxID=69370 RepID=A0A0M2HIE6_MICTR|nr:MULTISPECIES: carboxylesterase family protein [Microbacterium]KJL44560.1 Carboxylesterase [Microbacterium trichothecenolyticum]MDR7187502.1 para-nitrobenzyl esterase [Microbacterium sp. BE35]